MIEDIPHESSSVTRCCTQQKNDQVAVGSSGPGKQEACADLPSATVSILPDSAVSRTGSGIAEADNASRGQSRATPLKSLLKKPSLDADSSSTSSDSDSEDGNASPKKVHFSEIDQIKLMSQDSLASMAATELGDTVPIQACTTVITSTPAAPTVAR